jgi:hypothetical protein
MRFFKQKWLKKPMNTALLCFKSSADAVGISVGISIAAPSFIRRRCAAAFLKGDTHDEPGHIREHMPVVGADGSPVGTVDHLDGDAIKLTKNDPQAGGTHHWIPQDWIASVDDTVVLNKSCEDTQSQWYDSPPTESSMSSTSGTSTTLANPSSSH